jgi:hypothetical protein
MAAQQPASLSGSLDGTDAGDHDQPYTFGRRPSLEAPFPFSTRAYARLLVLRSRLGAVGLTAADLPPRLRAPTPRQIRGDAALVDSTRSI